MSSLIRKPLASRAAQGRSPWGRVEPRFYCVPLSERVDLSKVGTVKLVKAADAKPYQPPRRRP